MTLPAGSIWIRDQNKVIPNDNGLYIVVGMVDAAPIGNDNSIRVNDDGTLSEVQQVVTRENIQIDIFSADTQALFRRFEMLMALRSIYAQQQQELNSFKIFRIPTSFLNSSSAEGEKQINRFSLVIAVHSWYRKEKVINSVLGDFYDDFNTRVDDANTIGEPTGLIEFEIPATAVHAALTVTQQADTLTATATTT